MGMSLFFLTAGGCSGGGGGSTPPPPTPPPPSGKGNISGSILDIAIGKPGELTAPHATDTKVTARLTGVQFATTGTTARDGLSYVICSGGRFCLDKGVYTVVGRSQSTRRADCPNNVNVTKDTTTDKRLELRDSNWTTCPNS